MASHGIGRKKAVQSGRSRSWGQIAFTLPAIEADINKSQNKELQMVQCHIHFGVARVRQKSGSNGGSNTGYNANKWVKKKCSF